MKKAKSGAALQKNFKDIFKMESIPDFSHFYHFDIFVWKSLYKGFYKPWHKILHSAAEEKCHIRDMERLNMAKAVCAELANLIWLDKCNICVYQIDGGNTLDSFVHDILLKNNFWHKMQEHIEKVLALGGGAIKVWYEEKRDSKGNIIPDCGQIKLDFCTAEQFIPTEWDNSEVRSGIFISREEKGEYYYTRLEKHKWDGLTYYITNEAFRSKYNDNISQISKVQNTLGFSQPLKDIYPMLNPKTSIKGLTSSLFAYYRTAVVNNLDNDSPLGISIYANALSTLKALDICYDSFIQKLQLGENCIITPSQCLRAANKHVTSDIQHSFDVNDETYVAVNTDISNLTQISDNSIEPRIDEYERAINVLLAILCLQIGVSTETFTFDSSSGLKTNIESVRKNSKTYRTVKQNQFQIKNAVLKKIDAIIQIGCLYDLEYNGQKVTELAQMGWETKVVFDNSIFNDRHDSINESILLMKNGLMSKKKFMHDILCYTDDETMRELTDIQNEKIHFNTLNAAKENS